VRPLYRKGQLAHTAVTTSYTIHLTVTNPGKITVTVNKNGYRINYEISNTVTVYYSAPVVAAPFGSSIKTAFGVTATDQADVAATFTTL
jgi:hypothetical protein